MNQPRVKALVFTITLLLSAAMLGSACLQRAPQSPVSQFTGQAGRAGARAGASLGQASSEASNNASSQNGPVRGSASQPAQPPAQSASEPAPQAESLQPPQTQAEPQPATEALAEPALESTPQPEPEQPADAPPADINPNGTPLAPPQMQLPHIAESGGAAIILDTASFDTAQFELELLRLINLHREENGREPLGLEENLQWAARVRAPEVLGSLSHTRPDGTAYYSAFDEAGFVYAGKWHGENVCSLQFTEGSLTPEAAAGLMYEQLAASPGHYTNMLSEHFVQAGIGAFARIQDGAVTLASAQMFAGL